MRPRSGAVTRVRISGESWAISRKGKKDIAQKILGSTALSRPSFHEPLNRTSPECHAYWKKENALMPERKAQMEAVYTHMWASHDGGPFAPLDESLHPRPHTMLYEVAAACGVSASWQVFD